MSDTNDPTRQRYRLWLRSAFFALFVLAPPLDIFRLDLTLGHFILFGQNWTLGIDAFRAGETGAAKTALNIILRGFMPIAIVAALLIGVAWRWGRLYCGWLCPHFSVVEAINGLMLRTIARPTIWERHPQHGAQANWRLWPLTLLAIIGFAFIWALSLLTYLLPPNEIYHNLLNGELTRNQTVFLSVGTAIFCIEFLMARHLFCRFGCAVGLFQSLAWMANHKAMVVGFDNRRIEACVDCTAACDAACPMRLKPRSIKRRMFTCTQCSRCLDACETVRAPHGDDSLLNWLDGDCARHVSERDFGHHPDIPADCFSPRVQRPLPHKLQPKHEESN